jgi:uncharacterized protein (TIGR02145 family)
MEACPSGWHLPTDDEWASLEMAVGGSVIEETVLGIVVSHSNAGNILKSKGGWNHNKDLFFNEVVIFGNGTDAFGFSALPGGYLMVTPTGYVPGKGNVQTAPPSFISPGSLGYWWTASEHNNNKFANYRTIHSGNEKVDWHSGESKDSGLSVRCIKDSDNISATQPSTASEHEEIPPTTNDEENVE